MKSVDRFTFSKEAIAFQDGRLFAELVKIFDKAKKDGYKDDANQLSKLGIDDVVFKFTGLKVKTLLDEDVDFQIYPPVLTKNIVLIPEHDRKFFKHNLGLKYINQVKNDLLGTVDIKNCKVGGLFSKAPGTIALNPFYVFGKGLVSETSTTVSNGDTYTTVYQEHEVIPKYQGGWMHTPEQNAAVYLHEVGHLFTMFEYLVETVSTNLVINNICDELLETVDMKERMIVLASAEKALGLSITDKETLVKSENKNSIYTVLFSSNVTKLRSATDTSVYDIKSWEFLADQFAVRHGAGRHLADALYSFDKEYGQLKRTKFDVMASAVGFFFINLVLIPIGIGVLTSLLTLFWDFGLNIKEHDYPIQRFQRIKADIVQRLKNPKVSKEIKLALTDDIERIDFMLSTMEEHRSVMEVVWDFIRPARRDARKQYEFQMKMEKLAGNSMFVHAAKLSTLS